MSGNVHQAMCVCSCRAQRQAWDRVRTLRSSVLHIPWPGSTSYEVCSICRAGVSPSLSCQLPGAGGQGKPVEVIREQSWRGGRRVAEEGQCK